MQRRQSSSCILSSRGYDCSIRASIDVAHLVNDLDVLVHFPLVDAYSVHPGVPLFESIGEEHGIMDSGR